MKILSYPTQPNMNLGYKSNGFFIYDNKKIESLRFSFFNYTLTIFGDIVSEKGFDRINPNLPNYDLIMENSLFPIPPKTDPFYDGWAWPMLYGESESENKIPNPIKSFIFKIQTLI